MSNVLTADFLTIPSLLELDSEAAPSCFNSLFDLYAYLSVTDKMQHFYTVLSKID